MDATVMGTLVLGLIGGGLLGYLVGGLRRELFDRNLRHANTRLRSLEIDRQLLHEALESTRRELEALRQGRGRLTADRVEAYQHADDAGGSSPKAISVQIEEPDPVPLPELEFPKVRFG